MIMELICKIIEYKSDAYNQMLQIRTKVLREPLGLVYSTEQLQTEKDQIHIVIEWNQKIVGGLILLEEKEQKIKVRQVAIHPQFQSLGIGKELMLYAEKYASDKGFTYIHCHARNTAISFYTNLKYQIKGEEFLEVGIPHHYMYKLL